MQRCGRCAVEDTARRRLSAWSWSAATALLLGNFLAHKPISDLCDALFVRLGRPAYEHLTLLVIGGLSAAVAAVLLRGTPPSDTGGRGIGGRSLVALAALTAATLCAQRWLLVSNVEIIHFPQFGLLAILLLWAGMPPVPAWMLASLAGVADEIYQYLVIYDGVPHTYLDFNDMLLNAIGAAWAILLWSAPRDAGTGWRWPERGRWHGWALGVLVVCLLLLWADPPTIHPLLTRAATGRSYRVLSAPEAFIGFALLGALIVWAASSRRKSRTREDVAP